MWYDSDKCIISIYLTLTTKIRLQHQVQFSHQTSSSSCDVAFFTLHSHLIMRAFRSTMEVWCPPVVRSTTFVLFNPRSTFCCWRVISSSLQKLWSSGESKELILSKRWRSEEDIAGNCAIIIGSNILRSNPISLKNFSKSALFLENRALSSERSELLEYLFVRSDLDLWMAFLTRLLTAAILSSTLAIELVDRWSTSELVSVLDCLQESSVAMIVGMSLLRWGGVRVIAPVLAVLLGEAEPGSPWLEAVSLPLNIARRHDGFSLILHDGWLDVAWVAWSSVDMESMCCVTVSLMMSAWLEGQVVVVVVRWVGPLLLCSVEVVVLLLLQASADFSWSSRMLHWPLTPGVDRLVVVGVFVMLLVVTIPLCQCSVSSLQMPPPRCCSDAEVRPTLRLATYRQSSTVIQHQHCNQ